MMELAKRFLGKECRVYCFDSQVRGTIVEVDDGAILLQSKRGDQVLNLSFVTRIQEYPVKNK